MTKFFKEYKSLRIEITGRCNLKCLYCHASRLNTPQAVRKELGTSRIISIISEAKKLGCDEFTLIGGEPFVNKDWSQIVEKCGSNSTINITTNGHYFDEKNLKLIDSYPQIKEFRVSLDGLDSHDRIRRGSSYKKILEVTKFLVERFPEKRIVVQTTCNQQNLNELIKLYEKLKVAKIYRWRISQLWKFGRTKDNLGILEFGDYDEMFKVYKTLIQKYIKDKKPFQLGIYNVYNSQITTEQYIPMDLDTHPCLYHFKSICVKANGELTFCPALDIPFSSVKFESLEKALKSEWLTNFKKITIKSVHCQNCRYIKLCGGGCRADAYSWLGNINEIDPVSCCLMVRVEKYIVPILTLKEQKKYYQLIDKEGSFPPIKGKNAEECMNNFRKGGNNYDS